MRDSFVFYRSFYEACKELDAEEFKAFITAVCECALNEAETEIAGVPKILFTVAKPILQSNNKRYENGKKGGRPKNHRLSESETIGFENKKPNVNDNDNVNVNVNDKYIRAREKKTGKKIPFNQFEQRVYNYDQLEKRLLGQG